MTRTTRRRNSRPSVATIPAVLLLVGLPAGQCAAQSDLGVALYTVNRDGTSSQLLLAEPWPDYAVTTSPDWSPDGTRIVFNASTLPRNFRASRIGIYHLEGVKAGTVEELGYGVTPTWSPDGQKIAFSVYLGTTGFETSGVHTMNADGTNVKHYGTGYFPVWSPDGTYLFAQMRTHYDLRGVIRYGVADGTRVEMPLPPEDGKGRSIIRPGPDHTVLIGLETEPACQLVQYDASGESLVRLKTLATAEPGRLGPVYPYYHAATNEVFFSMQTDQEGRSLFRVALEEGAEPVMILPGTTPYTKLQDIVVSPDGERIIFKSDSFYQFLE